jgi:hypothetical protein
VLRAFERLSLEDAALLLNTDETTVAAAEAHGLEGLVRNLSAGRAPFPLSYTTN